MVSDEEDDQFFESLDRIASTSGSDTEEDFEHQLKKSTKPLPNNNPLLSASKYEIWKSEPVSVRERRQRLLQQFGIGLNSVAEISAANDEDDEDFYRSVSCDELRRRSSSQQGCSVSRSHSDGDALLVSNGKRDVNLFTSCNVDSRSSLRSLGSNSCCSSSSVVSKPRRANSKSPPGETNSNSDGSTAGTDVARMSAAEAAIEPANLIRNLDNGTQFVINEVDEDGTCSKLEEVGTGKQLTMEEFEQTLGHSPIVQELMRRERVELAEDPDEMMNPKGKRKGGWFKQIKVVAGSFRGSKEKKSSDEKDTSSEKGGRRSSSATDDSQDTLMHHTPKWTRVHQYGKSAKEFSAVYLGQEIQAHQGSIWAVKFSVDGRYLATAGQDRDIHVWQVTESERKQEDKSEESLTSTYITCNGPSEFLSLHIDGIVDRKKRGKISGGRKSTNLESVSLPDNLFLLSEKPCCTFQGHTDDILDLSWSQSQLLLSSSMDKTVRLWHTPSKSCLRIFSHNDFVTCIQFNPVDDKYFISGSLDKKVRIWSIPDRQVVDWTDLHEMVTAACYTPDGQGAYVGTNKGNCYLYNTSDNKLLEETQINVQNKKKRSRGKKITGFQFAPGSSQKVLISSADSRIRVFDGAELVKKYKGFKNTNSQISASFTANGKYVISASENSSVYIWNYDCPNTPAAKNQGICRAYEYFVSRNVYTAIPWPGLRPELTVPFQDGLLFRGRISNGRKSCSLPLSVHSQDQNSKSSNSSFASASNVSQLQVKTSEGNADIAKRAISKTEIEGFFPESTSPNSFPSVNDRWSFSGFNKNDACMMTDSLVGSLPSIFLPSSQLRSQSQPSANNGIFADSLSRGTATWPEEKLPSLGKKKHLNSPVSQASLFGGEESVIQDQSPAWGLVLVTAGLGGEIRTYQNYGWPLPSR